MKASTRWGSCPFLTLADGTIVGQTRALQRFIARHTGFYPEDFLQAASVDELIDALEDLPGMINSAGRGMEQKEKEAARVALVGADGNAGKILSAIDATIGAFGDGAGHSVGESITLADIATFTTTTHLFSGFFDGLDISMLTAWPNIQAVRKAVSNHPDVTKYYDEGAGTKMPDGQLATFKSARDL